MQILGIQGVDPQKFASYNVLEDPELRSGTVIPRSRSLVSHVPSLKKEIPFSIPFLPLPLASFHYPLHCPQLSTSVCSTMDTYSAGIKEYSEWPTIPQLYVNGDFVGGCDILMNMHQSGELEKVLDSAGVLVPAEEAEHSASTEGGEVLVGQNATEDIGVIHGEEAGGKKHDVSKDKPGNLQE